MISINKWQVSGYSAKQYFDGFYEMGTLRVMKAVLQKGEVFIDAGDSIGQMSFLGSRCVGPKSYVIAFEPHPRRFASLKQGIELNKITNIIAVNALINSLQIAISRESK